MGYRWVRCEPLCLCEELLIELYVQRVESRVPLVRDLLPSRCATTLYASMTGVESLFPRDDSFFFSCPCVRSQASSHHGDQLNIASPDATGKEHVTNQHRESADQKSRKARGKPNQSPEAVARQTRFPTAKASQPVGTQGQHRGSHASNQG